MNINAKHEVAFIKNRRVIAIRGTYAEDWFKIEANRYGSCR